jgi:hypothetical protein
VRVDARTETDFLELAVLGVAAGLLFLFLLLVLPLAIVHDAAIRRPGHGGNFDEVQAGFACPALGFVKVDDADLIVVVVDQANRGNPDKIIDAEPLAGFFDGRLETSLADGSTPGMKMNLLVSPAYIRPPVSETPLSEPNGYPL